MITETITDEFLKSHYFILEKPFGIEKYDEDCFPTGDYMELQLGSEWEVTKDNYIDGEIHLESNSCSKWLEISKETLKIYFSAKRKELPCS